MYGLPHLAINLWIVGVFTLAVTLINLPFIALDDALTPLWVAIGANFCFCTFFTIYIWGLLFQELDYGQPIWKIPIHLICALPIQPFASILEGMSAIWAMSSQDFGKFEGSETLFCLLRMSKLNQQLSKNDRQCGYAHTRMHLFSNGRDKLHSFHLMDSGTFLARCTTRHLICIAFSLFAMVETRF